VTKLAVVGAGGRMGRSLIEACASTDGFTLTVATERAGSSLLGVDAGEMAGGGLLNGPIYKYLIGICSDRLRS